jgi:hypothetical protein
MNLIPILLFLVFSGFSYHSEDELVLRAIKKDDTALLRKFLTKGVDIHQTYDGHVLLNYAARRGSVQSVLILLEEGAEADRFHNNRSPLIEAIRQGNLKIAERLIEHGANINLADSKGNTPFIHAARADDLDMIKLMFETGANFKAKNNKGKQAANYIDNLDDNPVLTYFNRMLMLHYHSDTLPDFVDGPHVALKNDEARVTYYRRDSSKNRTWKTFRHFPVEEGEVSFDGFAGDTASYQITLNPEPEKTYFKNIYKIFSVGDLHGNLDAFLVLLRSQDILDKNNRWNWDEGHLVVTGDIFDRGHQVTESLWFLHNLKQQAKRDGGDVHILLGNHEIMTMTGDYRYLHDKYIHLSVYFRKQQKELYSTGTFLGQWLRTKNVTIKVDKKIFVHGGFSLHVVNQELALDTINHIFRLHLDGQRYRVGYIQDLLVSANGPVWYRGYLMGNNAQTPVRQKDISKMLDFYDAEIIVVGHSEQYTVRSLYDGCVYAIDVPIGREGYVSQGLMIIDDKYYKCGECGSRILMENE